MAEGDQWDAPNQQVVRADESGPWEEGTGGSEAEVDPHSSSDEEPTLDEMTKNQLLAYADEHGIQVDQSMAKAEIRQAIDEA